MLKKVLLGLGFAVLLLPAGCMTTEPTIYSWPHHKRRIRTLLEDFHEFHMDLDRIIFDMEEFPIEAEH